MFRPPIMAIFMDGFIELDYKENQNQFPNLK